MYVWHDDATAKDKFSHIGRVDVLVDECGPFE